MSERKASTSPRPEGRTAVVFPGQGAQRPGMGSELHARFEVARRVFEEASDATGLDIANICFSDGSSLNRTEVTQPCLLTVEYAGFRVAVEAFGLEAQLFGGHSLGEYTALLAAGVLSLADAVRLVVIRGKLMAEAVGAGEGGMAALMMESIADSGVPAIVAALGAEVANYNSPHQVAISGSLEALEEVRTVLQNEFEDLDFVALPVSAPFHSKRMRPVAGRLLEQFQRTEAAFRLELATRVTSNLTGDFHVPEQLLNNLAEQVAAPVRWRSNMASLGEQADRIIEFGPRGPLSKFFRASDRACIALTKVAEFEQEFRTSSPPQVNPSLARPNRRQPLDPSRYVVGGMGWGVGTARLVERAARAGYLAFLGTSGRSVAELESELRWLRDTLPESAPWGMNISRAMDGQSHTERLVDLALRLRVPVLEVAGFHRPTPALVRARILGLSRGPDGQPRAVPRFLVKVSDESAASNFLAAPPSSIVEQLVASGELESASAELASRMTMADDICAAPGWGDEPGFPSLLLLPILRELAAQATTSGRDGPRIRVGLAGGLGSPESVAAAFSQGADFVLTGSINQCTVESGLHNEAKSLLAAAEIGDFGWAPTPESFELGGRVQVLKRGLAYRTRAMGVEQVWRRYKTIAAMPQKELRTLERLCGPASKIAEKRPLDDPATMIEMIRGWLQETRQRGVEGHIDRTGDMQIQGGPAIGALNRATRGSPLADWRKRHVDDVAHFLLGGAAKLLERHAQVA